MFELPDNTVRFIVGNPERGASAIWRVWSHQNEVYAGARSVVGDIKVSLHSSGVCTAAFIETSKSELRPANRRFLQWTITEFADGWARPLEIRVPDDALSPFPEIIVASEKKPIVAINPAPEGQATFVSVLLSTHPPHRTHPTSADAAETIPITRWSLPDGRTVWALTHEATLPEETQREIAAARATMDDVLARLASELDPQEGQLRAWAFGRSGDGATGVLTDLALDEPVVNP